MAQTIQWAATGTVTSILTTELNALGNGSITALSAAFDNRTTRYTDGFWELTVDFVSAPTVGTTCTVFAVEALDGTNYMQTLASSARVAATLTVDVTTAAQRLSGWGELWPFLEKFFLLDSTGQAFPATGSILKLVPGSREAA